MLYSSRKKVITIQDIYSLSLNDITPPNIASDEQISSLITALDPELQELSRASLEPLILSRIDELPENIIDLLAWQLHADFYDLAGTLKMKREAVKGSILWHMHKGTEWAIHEALRMIDISAEFVHWHDDDSEPYTFKLKAIVSGDFYRTKGRDKLISSIRRAVEESKAARSYMSGLETRINFHEDINLYHGVIPLLSGEERILLPKPDYPERTKIYAGIARVREGEEIIRLCREVLPSTIIYGGAIVSETRSEDIGVELTEMQELLRQFERRIFSRIDDYEAKTLATLNLHQQETTQRLEEIKEMLRWKGDDEDIT